jgi:hypothetical protein
VTQHTGYGFDHVGVTVQPSKCVDEVYELRGSRLDVSAGLAELPKSLIGIEVPSLYYFHEPSTRESRLYSARRILTHFKVSRLVVTLLPNFRSENDFD